MVDWYGRWTYVPNTPEEKKCQLDYIADYIVSTGYKPQTSIENMAIMAVLHSEGDCEEANKEWTVEKCIDFINETGISEFDYEC